MLNNALSLLIDVCLYLDFQNSISIDTLKTWVERLHMQ